MIPYHEEIGKLFRRGSLVDVKKEAGGTFHRKAGKVALAWALRGSRRRGARRHHRESHDPAAGRAGGVGEKVNLGWRRSSRPNFFPLAWTSAP